MKAKQNKTEQVTVRLTKSQADFLDTRAAKKAAKYTRSKVIRDILNKALSAHKYNSK